MLNPADPKACTNPLQVYKEYADFNTPNDLTHVSSKKENKNRESGLLGFNAVVFGNARSFERIYCLRLKG
jgi:hypothetical protein